MKGPTSKRHHRPTFDTSLSFDDNVNILHSTPIDINRDNRLEYIPSPTPAPAQPIIISPPSGFPYFSNILQHVGYTVTKPRNHIRTDQITFRNKLTEWVNDNPRAAPKFIEELEGYLSQRDNLLHAITPTSHPEDVFQNSLLHNLLTIPCLQAHVTKVIVPVITEAAYNGRTQEDLDLLSCILTQMKWLPELKDASGFVSVLLETTQNASPNAQKEIIRLLPDIVPESQHSKVVGVLKQMLQNDSEIVPCILDAFSSLDIPDTEATSIREIAMRQMLTAPLEDFPAYFAFLFRTPDSEVLDSIISEMRDNLELTAIGSDSKSASVMVEIVEKLRFWASVNPKLVPVWSKQVKQMLLEEKPVKPLDLIVLLIFAETSKLSLEPVKSILQDQKLTDKLLGNIIHHNLPMVIEVFSTLFGICDSMLRSKEPRVVENVIIKLFIALSPLQAQDIIGTLTTILINEGDTSRASVLCILTELTRLDPKKVLMFAPHLMAVLEYVKKFPTHQIRFLMNILATLAHLESNAESERFGVEFSILLRKQLRHTHTETRCFGVLGGLATVGQLCTNVSGNTGRITELIDLTWSCVKLEEEPCAIFFDELCRIVSRIPTEIRKNLQKTLMDTFFDSWTASDDKPGSSNFKKNNLKLVPTYRALFNSTERKNMEIVMDSKALGMNPAIIPAHFRILRLLTYENEGDLDKLNCLFSSPVRFPDTRLYLSDPENVSASTYNQRLELGRYIVLLINYFRECVSAFATFETPLNQVIVWYRLSCIVELQEHLVLNFAAFPSLPLAYAGENTNKITGNNFERPVKRVMNNPPKKTGKKKPTGNETETGEPPKKKSKKDSSKASSSKSSKSILTSRTLSKTIVNTSNIERSVQPPFLKPYLRRLDAKVFELLKNELVVENGDDEVNYERILQEIADGSSQAPKSQTFSPKTLGFLLLELNQQIEEKTNEFSVLNVRYLIRSIIAHLSTIDQLHKESDTLITPNISSCLLSLLKILCIYFEKFNEMPESSDKGDKLRRILRSFSRAPGPSQIQPKKKETASNMAKNIAEYFQNLSCCKHSPAIAVQHLKCLVQFLDLVEHTEPLELALVKLSHAYLKEDSWSQILPPQVEYMLKTYLKYSDNPLECVEKVMDSVFNLKKSIPCEDLYRTCKMNNCQSWYSILFSDFVQHIQKNAKGADAEFWKKGVLLFQKFVVIAGNENIRAKNFTAPLFKNAKIYIETFITHGIKIIPLIWKNVESLRELIHPLQTATRKLQIYCAFSKTSKDLANIRRVPIMKKVLESLVFRVREVMSLNGAPEAIEFGHLKNRNMDEEVVGSQPYNPSANEEDETGETDPDLEAMNFDSDDDAIPNGNSEDDNSHSDD